MIQCWPISPANFLCHLLDILLRKAPCELINLSHIKMLNFCNRIPVEMILYQICSFNLEIHLPQRKWLLREELICKIPPEIQCSLWKLAGCLWDHFQTYCGIMLCIAWSFSHYSFHIVTYYFSIDNLSVRCHIQTKWWLNYPDSIKISFTHCFVAVLCSGMWHVEHIHKAYGHSWGIMALS